MSKLEELTRKMQELEANGDVTEEELGTYKALLEAVDALKDCHARLELLTESGRSKMLDACAKHKAALVLEKLK